MAVESELTTTRRRATSRRIAITLLAGIAIFAAVAFSQREALHVWSLNRKSTAELAQLEPLADADVYAHYLYARRLVDSGDVSGARPPAERAVKALTDSTPPELAARTLALTGFLAADSGDEPRAEQIFKQTETAIPNDPFAHLARGTIATKHDRKAEAAAELEKAVQADPNCAESWRRLGNLYLAGAEPEMAADALRHAAAAIPNDSSVHMNLGQAYLQTRRFPEAEAEYREVARLAPNDSYAATMPLRVAAFAARTEPEYEQALVGFKRALDAQPGDVALHAELAGLHMRFCRFDAAREELVTILSHNPMISADCWLNLQTVYRRLGDPVSAATAQDRFNKIIALKNEAADLTEQDRLKPGNAKLNLHLSNVLMKLGKTNEAFAALSRAVSQDPNDPEIGRALAAAQAMQRARR